MNNVFKIPVAEYVDCENVSGSGFVAFVADDVSLNTLSPVLNLGLPLVFGFGIANTPDTKPLADVTRLPPNEPPVGVTNAVTFCLSKNGYTLVRGFIPVTENDTFFARMKGTKLLI